MSDSSGRLVVVLCTERSGSTLLTMMLGGHHQIAAPPELHLFRYPHFEAWRRGYPKAIASLCWLMEEIGQPASESELAARFRGRDPESIYRELLELCGPDRFLIDKTPAYARDPEVLARIETLQPLYIWLVRHPLGVAASLMARRSQSYADRQRKAEGMLRKAKLAWARARNSLRDLTGRSLKTHLGAWCNAHLVIESFLAQVPEQRWRRVHYEQLAGSPQLEMESLCAWMAIQPEPAMLRPWENVPSALVWDLGDEKVLHRERVDTRVAERWRERFDEHILDQRTREMIERFEEAKNNG